MAITFVFDSIGDRREPSVFCRECESHHRTACAVPLKLIAAAFSSFDCSTNAGPSSYRYGSRPHNTFCRFWSFSIN